MKDVDNYIKELKEVENIYMKNNTFEGAMCDFMKVIASNLIEIKYLLKEVRINK